MYKTFSTGRLHLAPTSTEDAPFILQLLNTPDWIKYIGDRKVRTVKDAENYIRERMLPQLERLGYTNYTVTRLIDGIQLGVCGLYDREGLEGVDIGFAFLPEFYGQGYAFEAAQRLMEAAVAEFDIRHIKAITTDYNHASVKLLKKLGFHQTGTTFLPNDPEELMVFEWNLPKDK